jgi:endonuclease G
MPVPGTSVPGTAPFFGTLFRFPMSRSDEDPLRLVRQELSDESYAHYTAYLPRIERIRSGIQHNRQGHLALLDITDDASRRDKRIAREHLDYEQALERINGVPNFQDVSIVRRLARHANSICRIATRNAFGVSGYGTGFLIHDNILLTNNHVLPDAASAERANAQFNYEISEAGETLPGVTFRLRPDQFFCTSPYRATPEVPFSGRDFTMVAVEPLATDGSTPLGTFGSIRLDGTLGKIIEGENCVVVQHPGGDYKKVVLKDIRMITLTENFLIYESDTLPGSSGSAVIGLGTGELVALHHSAVPRKDIRGNWLSKDGRALQPPYRDEEVDWLGNEGVRVSCIVEALREMALPTPMHALRAAILGPPETAATRVPATGTAVPGTSVPGTSVPGTPARSVAGSTGSAERVTTPAGTVGFELLLTDEPRLLEAWAAQHARLVPGLVREEALLPHATDPVLRRRRYLTLRAGGNPWQQAAALEALPHVVYCFPDLPVVTDLRESDGGEASPLESGLFRKDGTSTWNETEFLRDYARQRWIEAARQTPDGVRWWNWRAINCAADADRTSADWQAVRQNLPHLRFVQLDTGYSPHSKLRAGIDTAADYDFLDDDADTLEPDEPHALYEFPGHGTRTASIAVGGPLETDPRRLDGNGGLLRFGNQVPVRLIPYRIARSVMLIGRGKQLAGAVQRAIEVGTDVLFMCMGSYPRPLFADLAREAYDHGLIWVCAAGNQVKFVVAPACYPGTITVAASNPDDRPWRGSSRGPAVDVAAPGEGVYVPFLERQTRAEIMVYGDGTSYATPHVASAAMLWKARYLPDLTRRYHQPWQVVEAFRTVLRATARRPIGWDSERYGAGILDVSALLAAPLPDPAELRHAYSGVTGPVPPDLGLTELVHETWSAWSQGTAAAETRTDGPRTTRGQAVYDAFSAPTSAAPGTESGGGTLDAEALLSTYFSHQTPTSVRP